jgi:tryptophan-rich sensory protein
MSFRVIEAGLVVGALWDFFTTLQGVADYFDLPTNPNINPAQFMFALVVTAVVFGFVMATHIIWNIKGDELPTLLLKAAWAICIAIDLFTSWEGTKRFIFYGDDSDPARGVGLAVVTALIVSSSILLAKLLFTGDLRGKA